MSDREFDRAVERAGMPVLAEFRQPGRRGCRALTRELNKLQPAVEGRVLTLKRNEAIL